jgi:hemerythrin
MRKLLWTSECKTGFDEIDSQHRLLFAICNELLEIANPARQQDELKYLLHHLVEYIEKHFNTEEEYLERHSYPGIKEHKMRHAEITSQIREVISQSKSMSQLKEQLDTMLDKWIRIHVLIEDKKYSVWAASKGIIIKSI